MNQGSHRHRGQDAKRPAACLGAARRFVPGLVFCALALVSPSVFAGALEVLSQEIAQEAGTNIATLQRSVKACVYVDQSLSPTQGAESLARSVASALSGQRGVSDVLEAKLSTLAEAPTAAYRAGCDLAVVIAFEAPQKNARSRVFVLSAQESPIAAPLEQAGAIGEPFLSSMIKLPAPPITQPTPTSTPQPQDLSKGWRIQQISITGDPILSMLSGSLPTPDGEIPLLFALSRSSLSTYRFEARPKPTSLFAAPKETSRLDLSSQPRAPHPSRDPVGALIKEGGRLLLRTSDLASTYEVLLEEKLSLTKADNEEAVLWPITGDASAQHTILGNLKEGTNTFSPKAWLLNTQDPEKKQKTELPLADPYVALSLGSTPKERLLAVVDETRSLALYNAASFVVWSQVGKVGAQVLLADLDQDGTSELITTSVAAPGEGDSIMISTLEEKGARKVWQSGALYAPAGAVPAGKSRPLAWVTALAAGDIDGDGRVEVIAALSSPVGNSILVVAR